MQNQMPHIGPRQVAVAVLLAMTFSLPMYLYVKKMPVKAPAQPAPHANLKIATFNTEYWHTSESELVDAVHYEDMDVVLFQEHLAKHGETWGPTNRIAELKAVLKERVVDSEGEVVTVSKWPIVYRRAYSDGGPDGQVLRTDLNIDGRIVSVYNMHLPVHLHMELLANPMAFYRDLKANAARRERTLKTVIDDISSNKNPVVVGGDFNASYAMHGADWFRTHLSDAYAAAHCERPGDTFTMNKIMSWRIDYIYVSKQLTPTGYCTETREDISDHRAVLASINFNPSLFAPITLSQKTK